MNEFQIFFNENKKTVAICLLIFSFLLVIWGFSGSIMKIVACIGGLFLGKWCIRIIWPDDKCGKIWSLIRSVTKNNASHDE